MRIQHCSLEGEHTAHSNLSLFLKNWHKADSSKTNCILFLDEELDIRNQPEASYVDTSPYEQERYAKFSKIQANIAAGEHLLIINY